MSSTAIEPAKTEDIPDLVELLGLLFAQEAEFNPDTEKQTRGLREITADPRAGVILVAREGTRVAGMVSLQFVVSTATGGRVALLEDMIVRPDVRNQGIGSRLLGAAIAVAQSEGCARITLLTDRINAAAQRFYGRNGFRASPMSVMRLML